MKNIKITKKIIGILISGLFLFFITLQIWAVRSLKTITNPKNKDTIHINYHPSDIKKKILIFKGRSNINGHFAKNVYLQYGTENNSLNYIFDANDSAIVITPRNPFVKRPDKLYLELYGIEKIYIYDRSKLTLGLFMDTDSLKYNLSVNTYGLSKFDSFQPFDTLKVNAYDYSTINIQNTHYLQIFTNDNTNIYNFSADIITGKIKQHNLNKSQYNYYVKNLDNSVYEYKQDTIQNREYRDLILEPK